ncbi:hypothetical protein HY480_02805, partial [Candidatus Uhrbacteria bacterium]|nr:hypothetical protein [Candidatus Uhrbacteria bacterium]
DILGFFHTLARLCWRKDDHRFAVWIGVALVLLTGLPYLYGWLRTPIGYTYTGLHAIGGGDAHVYYSYIEQARDGAFAFRDLFTGEPNAPLMTQLPWLAVGLVARAFHWSAPLAFHLVRLALIIPYVLFLSMFTAAIIRAPIAGWSVQRLRRAALLLIVFGGGIGGLFGGAFAPIAYDTPAYSAWPLDFSVPEAFTFLTAYQSPHFIISTWFLLAVYLATVRAAATGHLRHTVVAAITAAVLVQFHPFYIPLIAAIVGIHTLVRMIVARRWIPAAASLAFWTGLAMLPAFAYWFPIATLDPIHASRTAQNMLLMPPLGYVFAGYGFLLPLAGIGLVAVGRRAAVRRTPEMVFLCTWIAMNTLMLWAPLAWQRRFTQGFSIALALLAAIGIAACVGWMRARLTPAWYTMLCNRMLAVTLTILLFSFTHLVNIGRDVAYFTMRFPTKDPKFMFYYPTAGLDGMRWLRQHASRDDVTLALGLSANFIPGIAARTTYVGHDIETVRMAEKKQTVIALINPETPPARAREILSRERIRYLFVASFEPPAAHLARVAEALALPRVYANDAVTIYKVPK